MHKSKMGMASNSTTLISKAALVLVLTVATLLICLLVPAPKAGGGKPEL